MTEKAQNGLAEELERWRRLHCNVGSESDQLIGRVIAALRQSPQPAEQQEAVAWTTELALETAKQIGSIGFTVCPENIWGDKGVALTRARPASVAGDSVRVPKDE